MVGTGNLYRIDGPRRFVELQRVGSRQVKHVVDATAYPEQLRVLEMVECANGAYEVVSHEEWERALATDG